MKNLPIGIQSFEDIRRNNYLYVDKTEHIYRLVTTGKIYFLSRPRRFGKSLTLSTLEALFTGRKELFEGLYIHDKWDWNRKYPVIRIDWADMSALGQTVSSATVNCLPNSRNSISAAVLTVIYTNPVYLVPLKL